jgi:hypothetical protein
MTAINPPSWLQGRADHTAQGDRLVLDGLIASSGVCSLGDLAVTAQTTPNMTVRVGAGRAFIRGTQSSAQGVYHIYNDANTNVTISSASPTQGRRDLIIARVYDANYSGSLNEWRMEVVTGTPSASPVPPATPNNSLVLATITVNPNATSITNANISGNPQVARSQLAAQPILCTATTRPPGQVGMLVYETDTRFVRRFDTQGFWRAIDYLGDPDTNGGMMMRLGKVNQSVTHTVWNRISNYDMLTTTPLVGVSSQGFFTFNERNRYAITAHFQSDSGAGGFCALRFVSPVIPGGELQVRDTRVEGFSGSGNIHQTLAWTGAIDQGTEMQIQVNNTPHIGSANVSYSGTVTITALG